MILRSMITGFKIGVQQYFRRAVIKTFHLTALSGRKVDQLNLARNLVMKKTLAVFIDQKVELVQIQ